MRLQYDPHSSTLYDATSGAAVAVLYDDLPAAERHALGRLFAAAEGMREALSNAQACMEILRAGGPAYQQVCAALRATEPPA